MKCRMAVVKKQKKNIVMNECMECTLNFARYIKAEER